MGHILSTKDICLLPSKTQAIQKMHPPTTPKQVCAFLGLVGYYRKFIKNFCKDSKAINLAYKTTSHSLNGLQNIMKSLWNWKNPSHRHQFYIIPTPASLINSLHRCFRWCLHEFQLTQEHDGTEFPIAFLSHTFLETKRKLSTTEQEAYGVYYAVTKWNYYLQGADIIVRNDHKPLTKFLNGKNANNKVNRWGLELASLTILHLNGYQEIKIKQLTAYPT